MAQEQRLVDIVSYLNKHQKITVDEICTLFHVSRDTARRDLVKLEEEQAIIRTRGGALLPKIHRKVDNYHNRLKAVSEEKKRLVN